MPRWVITVPIANLYEESYSDSLAHQLLLGEGISLLKEEGKRRFISTENERYTGWLPNNAFSPCKKRYAEKNIIVASREILLNNTVIYAGTKLEVMAEGEKSYRVVLPSCQDGIVSKKDIIDVRTGGFYDIVETAHTLSGWEIPYLLGGISPLGIDCSGLMKLILRMNRIDAFPRDSWQQYARTSGAEYDVTYTKENLVDYKALLPGDMVFFTAHGRAPAITHVGMMVNNDSFLHASKRMHEFTNGKNCIAISMFENDAFFGNYYSLYFIGGRRFFHE